MSRVYLGRLPTRCSERDIEKFFKGYGHLRDIVLKNGYGFVEFDDHKDAEDAVYDLHGRDFHGERVLVEHARLPPGSRGGGGSGGGGGGGGGGSRRPNRDSFNGRRYGPPTRTEYRVIVENLSSRVSWQDLKDMMRKAGEVNYADAHKSARNEGIVEFASYSDMKSAIDKFDGYTLYDRRLKVFEDKPRRRSPSGSRRRSRSLSRGKGFRRRDRTRSRSISRQKDRSLSGGRDRTVSRSVSRRKDRSISRTKSHRDISHESNLSRRARSRSLSRHSSKSPYRNIRRRSTNPTSRSPSRKLSNSFERKVVRSISRSKSRSPLSHSVSSSRSISRSRSRSRRSFSREQKHSDEDIADRAIEEDD